MGLVQAKETTIGVDQVGQMACPCAHDPMNMGFAGKSKFNTFPNE